MKILITSPPAYTCQKKRRHHKEFLGAWVGLKMVARRNPSNPEEFLVTPFVAIHALAAAGKILGHSYWHTLWADTDGLHEPFVFPATCCRVLRIQVRTEVRKRVRKNKHNK